MHASHTLHVELDCADEATARAVQAAVAIEGQDGPGGSRIRLAAHGRTLHIDIEATEEGNLKAAANSALRLADMALRALS